MSSGSGKDDEGVREHPLPESGGEDEEALKSLLHALGAVARADDAEAAAFSGGEIPSLSAEARDALVQRMLAARARPAAETAASLTIDRRARAEVGDIQAARRRTTARRTAALVAFSLAAAAAVVVWIRPASDDLSLPGYAIAAQGGIKDVRGGGAAEAGGQDPSRAPPQRVRPSSELVISVRPDTPVSGPITARAFVVQGTEVAEARAADLRVAPSGAAQLVLKGADLIGQRQGQAILRVVVGRTRALEGLDPRRVARESSGPGWRVLTVPLAFEAP